MTPLTRRDTPAVGAPLHTHVTHQVQLTWDETDHERVTAMNRKFNKDELLDMDFRAYLASSSEEEEREDEAESRQESRGEQSRVQLLPWKPPPHKVCFCRRGGDQREEEGGADVQVQRAAQRHPGEGEEAAGGQGHGDGGHLGARYRHTWPSAPHLGHGMTVVICPRTEGDHGAAGEEEAGAAEAADALGGVSAEEEGEEEAEAMSEEAGEKLSRLIRPASPSFSSLTSESAHQEEEELSDDELPADVDLTDPFFAEERADARERSSTNNCLSEFMEGLNESIRIPPALRLSLDDQTFLRGLHNVGDQSF